MHGINLGGLTRKWLAINALVLSQLEHVGWEEVAWRSRYATLGGLSDLVLRVTAARLTTLEGEEWFEQLSGFEMEVFGRGAGARQGELTG